MQNDTANAALAASWLPLPVLDLRELPARVSKRLWVSPSEFLLLTHALLLAECALGLARRWRLRLTAGGRRGPKVVYQDASILVMALVQVAWQMSYEEIVDYLRARPEAACAAGFTQGRVIG